MKPAVLARDLTKSFREGWVAVNGLDLAIEPGTIYGLVGRNGAGKSTLLRLLMGLLRPDQGVTSVLGQDLWEAPKRHRQRVSYVGQHHQLPGWMDLEHLSRYLAHLSDDWEDDLAKRWARRWDLSWTRPVARMSVGQQRKTALALAFAGQPEVLLLDEPAGGLDPIARRELLDGLVEIVAAGSGCTVLFSTHQVGDLERLANRVGMMDRGRIVVDSPLDALLETTKRVQVVFQAEDPPENFNIPGARRTQVRGPVASAIVQLASEEQLDPVRKLPGVRVDVFPLGLEEIFIELFGRNGQDMNS